MIEMEIRGSRARRDRARELIQQRHDAREAVRLLRNDPLTPMQRSVVNQLKREFDVAFSKHLRNLDFTMTQARAVIDHAILEARSKLPPKYVKWLDMITVRKADAGFVVGVELPRGTTFFGGTVSIDILVEFRYGSMSMRPLIDHAWRRP